MDTSGKGIFTTCFCVNLITTLRQAWAATAPKTQTAPMEETTPAPIPPTYATLKWEVVFVLTF